MATVKDSIPHVVRTAEDPRQAGIHKTVISRIELVNQNIRVLRLSLIEGPARHLPGQYVDLYVPDIETVGGFTITSPPVAALAPNQTTKSTEPHPFVELAIQKSPKNPPAAYLYQDPSKILNAPINIRIGGSFTYPPFSLNLAEFQKISNIVFIAGGVGINPIMSMLSSMDVAGSSGLAGMKKRVRVLYSSKRIYTENEGSKSVGGEEILFERRLQAITKRWQAHPSSSSSVDLKYTLFETTSTAQQSDATSDGNFSHVYRRISHDDIFDALGEEKLRGQTLVYVCGHPSMTDEYIELLRGTSGLDEKRVLCEKWW